MGISKFTFSFDLQLFPQDLFDTAWLRGKRLPAGPWPKGSVLPLHPPEAWFACPKDPVQHTQAMSGVQRPANMLPPLGRFLEEAVDFVATCATHDALSLWAVRLKSLLQLAEEFAPRRINAKKRTVLLKHALQSVGYQDTAIADELAAGFPLFGWLPESMELPTAVDIASLERMAPALQARALARCQPTDDPAADQTLFDTTLTELQQGWLDGPFLAPDVPRTSVISLRFYVLQSDKCRPIDDFTFNLLNSAVGSANKVVLHDTDFIAALLKRCCSYNEVPWRGRAFDLQDAYRQLAITPAHRAHSFICVHEPMHGPRCYRMLTMPFGSSALVYAFLRIGLAIHAQRCHAPDQVLVHLTGFSSQWQALQEPAVCSSVSGAWGCLQPFRGLRGGKHRDPNPTPGF